MPHEALLALVKAAGSVDRAANEFFSAHELTAAQFNVMWILYYATLPLTQVDIGEKLIVSRSNITGILDRLEQKDMIERKTDPDDRRIYHIALTSKGRQAVNALSPDYLGKVRQIMSALAKKESELLLGFLEKIQKGLETNRP